MLNLIRRVFRLEIMDAKYENKQYKHTHKTNYISAIDSALVCISYSLSANNTAYRYYVISASNNTCRIETEVSTRMSVIPPCCISTLCRVVDFRGGAEVDFAGDG